MEHAPKKGYGFRGWRYATAQASLGSPSATPFAVCLDTGCTMSLVDCGFFQQQCPDTKINTMPTPMEVRGIESVAHNANQFALMDIYLQGTDGCVALIQREVHLVDELKANMLIGIDILAPEDVSINLSKQEAIITSCANVHIPLSIETQSGQIQRTVFSGERTVIPPHTRQSIPVHGPKGKPLDLPQDWDLLFEPGYTQKVSVYAHIVSSTMKSIYVQNNSDQDVVLPCNIKIGEVLEYKADGCFLASSDDVELATRPAK